MTKDATYEAAVSALETRYHRTIASQALRMVREGYEQGQTTDEVQDDACERLSAYLLNAEDWERVEAVDISDIAYEAVNRAIDEV